MKLPRAVIFLALLCRCPPAAAEEAVPAHAAAREALQTQFDGRIATLLADHCGSCHDASSKEADLDVTLFAGIDDVARFHDSWGAIEERVAAGEMPPADADTQPTDAQRAELLDWIRQTRQLEATRNAGDPGPVLARRLSNAEYDYSVRDLTGADIRPTKTFPVDPANAAGFDNSGESLTMSPALLKKYLEAARAVSEHMVLSPDGIAFAQHPVVTDTDRDRYCVRRIVDFYERQPTDLAEYFRAAWAYRNRDALGQAAASIEKVAADHEVSERYLRTVLETLEGDADASGPLGKLRTMWAKLPAEGAPAEDVRRECEAMRDYVVGVRKHFEPYFANLDVDEIHNGAQAFVLWKNKQYASHRRSADFGYLDGKPDRSSERRKKDKDRDDDAENRIELPPELKPEGVTRVEFEDACREFCSVFPDAFYISERGRDYLGVERDQQEKGRLLSAGFHSMTGYFRDDTPLCELVLDDAGRAELNSLWKELDFFANAPQRQYQGFLWFERTDSRYLRDEQFDFARPENRSALEQDSIERLASLYLAKAVANGAGEVAQAAIRDYFSEIDSQIRWVERARREAEGRHLDEVVAFAGKAFRRPMTTRDEQELRDFYAAARAEDLGHEEAMQDTIVFILMSPNFCYRHDLLGDSPSTRPLNGIELASRLSFFLWSSVPDDELLSHAASGDLLEPAVLRAQTQRMLRDERSRALAVEFGGNWLDFRRFEEHNSVDRVRFQSFDDRLRSAMFEEPVRFIADVAQRDRSVLDFLYADRAFLNHSLADHYGIDGLEFDDGQWREVQGVARHGRGGLLAMSVFLTKNSPGLRTSPVKRGYWVVRRLLGERIPAPPPDVPELPADESQLGELTLRETLEKHREHASCAGCHKRFDSIGLAFEGYGPIGERRDLDLGGRPVDTAAEFPDGTTREGLGDLRDYIREQREDDFVDNLCRKLLAYSLGRTLLLSDEPLIDEMKRRLAENDHRFGSMIESIVTSAQFLNKRGRDAADSLVSLSEELP